MKSSYLKRVWGLSPADLKVRLTQQGGRCAICAGQFGPQRKVYIDHDHRFDRWRQRNGKRVKVRGPVRGLLCFYCNRRVLGYVERAGKHRVLAALGYLGWL